MKSWEECLPFVEFAYNRSTHCTTNFSPFEVVYGFNPLTPLDLLPLPCDEKASLDGRKKAELVKSLHEKVRQQIEQKTKQYASQANKNRKKVVFEPGDWVWVHMQKERFLQKRLSKLHPRGDGPFQVVARINDNAYKLDLPGEYNVSATFNVADLSPFDFDEGSLDSRTNPSEEGGNDGIQESLPNDGAQGAHSVVDAPQLSTDPLSYNGGPITRSRAKKLLEGLNGLIQDIRSKDEQNCYLNKSSEDILVHLSSLSYP